MRFHEHIISSFIPDFVEIQQKSFSTLLKKGLIKELSKINPIRDSNHNLELFFYPQYYQLTRPTLTPTEAISKLKTYASKLYVPVQLTNKRTKKIKLHWFLLCDFPLMTKRGHFIINGCPRVVVNQLMRSPGIYYQHRIIRRVTTTVNRFYADIIPSRGTWLRLECNNSYSHTTGRKKQRVWARMKRIDKISGFLFLYCFKPKEWFHLTNATDDPTDSTIVLKRVYPFIEFLKVLFFQHSFKNIKEKEEEKEEENLLRTNYPSNEKEKKKENRKKKESNRLGDRHRKSSERSE